MSNIIRETIDRTCLCSCNLSVCIQDCSPLMGLVSQFSRRKLTCISASVSRIQLPRDWNSSRDGVDRSTRCTRCGHCGPIVGSPADYGHETNGNRPIQIADLQQLDFGGNWHFGLCKDQISASGASPTSRGPFDPTRATMPVSSPALVSKSAYPEETARRGTFHDEFSAVVPGYAYLTALPP